MGSTLSDQRRALCGSSWGGPCASPWSKQRKSQVASGLLDGETAKRFGHQAGDKDLPVPERMRFGHDHIRARLRQRGLLVPALAVESEGCLLQPAARVRLPSTHAPIVA